MLKQVSISSFQENFVPKMEFIQRRSSLLIINIFEIVDLDPKLKIGQIWFQNCNVPNFYEIWRSEQIECANY